MSSRVVDQLTREQRRQQEREERRRKREQSRDSASLKTTAKEEKATRKTSVGNGRTKAPSSVKRSIVPAYNKVNVIERTAKFDGTATENDGTRSKSASRISKVDVTRRRGGANFKDHLSKFECQTKPVEKGNKAPFVRSQNGSASDPKKIKPTSGKESEFRRSYRTNGRSAAADDARHRRSLKSERIADRIAKLELQSSSEEGSNKNASSSHSKGSSATSSQTSLTESNAGPAKTISRAQEALERHKKRIRSSSQGERSTSPGKRSSPVTKTSGKSEPKSKNASGESQEVNKGEQARRISVSATHAEGDAVEVTTVTEVVSVSDETMNIVIKEVAVDEEDAKRLLSPIEGKEYQPGDPRPVSVEQVIATFTKQAEESASVETLTTDRELPTESPPKTMDLNHMTNAHDVIIIETTTVVEESDLAPQQPVDSSIGDRDRMTGEITDDVTTEVTAELSDTEPSQQQEAVSTEEAINILKRLSGEVQSGKEEEVGETKVAVENDHCNVTETEKRPTTLQIEEVLYVKEHPPSPPPPEANPAATSSSFASAREVFSASASSSGTSSPVKSWGKYSVELSSASSGSLSPTKSRKLELSSHETTSSGSSSPTKVPAKSLASVDSATKTVVETTSSKSPVTPPGSPVSPVKSPVKTPASPVKSPESLVKYPESPVKSAESTVESRESPVKFPESPVKFPESPVKSPESPVKSPESPLKSPKSSESPVKSPESPVKPPVSPVKSPESPLKSPESPVTSAESPVKSPGSPVKSPESPVKSPESTVESREAPVKSPESPVKFPESPVKSPGSPLKSPESPVTSAESPVKSPESPVKSPESPLMSPESPVKSPESPVKSPAPAAESSTEPQNQLIPSIESSRVSSPDKSVSQIKEIFETNKAGLVFRHPEEKSPDSPVISSITSQNSYSPGEDQKQTRPSEDSNTALEATTPPSDQNSAVNVELYQSSSVPSIPADSSNKSENITSCVQREPELLPTTQSPQSIPEQKKTNPEMLAMRSAPRYKKSWLDESDDDNMSVLSDAASHASSIDMDWLGADSNDESAPKKSGKPQEPSTTVQRSSSSAQDMLKMWEKKVHEPAEVKKNAPEKILEESLKRVESVREAWKSGNRENEPTQNGHSADAEASPRKSPKRENKDQSSPLRDASFQSASSKESQEIFEDLKTSGRIGGAKAMFETLSQSPKKSPLRSPRKRAEPRDQSDSKEYSSVSQESSSSQVSDSQDESLIVENMRAMFERQNGKKKEIKKKKTSLAEMVSDDEWDITDVRSVKAMWESMENPRSEGNSPQKRLSNVQRRISTRRQEKRSMTQPVTSDDVMKAQDIMKDSLKASSDTEEEELNFVDRLKFFNQLAKSSPNKTRVRRKSDTHPVKSSPITEAARLFEEERNKKQTDVTEKAKDRPPPISLVDVSPSDLSIISPTIEALTRKSSTSGSENSDTVRSSSDVPEPGRRKFLLSSQEEENDMSTRVAEIKTTGSIHDRMKRLQKKQTEERWKKSSKNSEVKSSVSERLNLLKVQEDKWKKSSNSEFISRVDKLSDRISKMKEDSETWKGRSGKQNDAAQFTVQAKLAKRDGKKLVAVSPSPVVKRRALREDIPADKQVSEKDVTMGHDSASMNQLSFVEKLSRKGLEENVIKTTEVRTIEVPTIDHEEFDKFFGSSRPKESSISNGFHEDIENFPAQETVRHLSDLGRLKSSVKLQTKRRSSKRNPLKVLAARTDLKLSYDSERSNVGKLEQQRIAVQRGHGANFTSAALAGLAAKADLKKVNLRSTKNTPMLSNDDLKPFSDVMLFRAKGRRKVQTRLVEPKATSLCSDDAFLLVTPSKLFAWFGEYCNVIERAKINEIADYIVIKGDLGCKVNSYKTIEESSSPSSHQDFWDILGGRDEWDRRTIPGSDEQYEVDVETTVKTYRMIDSKLVPHAAAWGKLPKMSMLQPTDTYVFDFGAEMYIWQGKEVSFADRRLAVRLARVLWEEDYDFTEQRINPFHGKALKGPRPDFGLFARVNENLETSLFQEKFEDWSNIYRETGDEEAKMRETSRGKSVEEMTTKSDIAVEAKPCEVTQMIENRATHSPTILDGYDVSCYDEDLIDEDGRVLEIVTEQSEQYFVSESGVDKIDDSVLHRENCYVIKWKYLIKSSGRFATSKDKNSKSTPNNSGRSKVAYFSWIGSDSATSEKSTSALIASNMETEDWPVMSFTESTMPPVFRRCFNGNLMISNGKRGVRRGGYNWKLLKVIGSTNEAATLSEIPCECRSLRSCSSFVALHPRDAKAIIWHGCRSPQNVKEAAEYAVSQLRARMPKSIPFRRGKTSIDITVCEEGEEPDGFWEAIGLKRRNRYECLVDSTLPTVVTRGWQFDIISGEFCAKELQSFNPHTLLPLHQNQLTAAATPSLILIECTQGIYLWQNCDLESMAASAKRRWDVIRRLAIETTIRFCEERSRNEATLIELGFEPNMFTNAFPSWICQETSTLGRQKISKAKPVSEVLASLSRLVYTIDELRSKELPDGVDARYLETYLSNEDFEKLFEMSKQEYNGLPRWKQIKLRQQKNFF